MDKKSSVSVISGRLNRWIETVRAVQINSKTITAAMYGFAFFIPNRFLMVVGPGVSGTTQAGSRPELQRSAAVQPEEYSPGAAWSEFRTTELSCRFVANRAGLPGVRFGPRPCRWRCLACSPTLFLLMFPSCDKSTQIFAKTKTPYRFCRYGVFIGGRFVLLSRKIFGCCPR